MIHKQQEMAAFNFTLDNLPTYQQLYTYVQEEDKNDAIHMAITSLLTTTNPEKLIVKEVVKNIIGGIKNLQTTYPDEMEVKLTKLVDAVEGFSAEKIEESIYRKPAYHFDSVEIQLAHTAIYTTKKAKSGLTNYLKGILQMKAMTDKDKRVPVEIRNKLINKKE